VFLRKVKAKDLFDFIRCLLNTKSLKCLEAFRQYEAKFWGSAMA